MSDIVERLNDIRTTHADAKEAAAEITTLRAERDRLREALKKITEYDLHWHPECRHDCSEIARTALKETT